MAQGCEHDAGHVRVVPRLVRLPGGKADCEMGGVGGKRLTAMKRGSLPQWVGGGGFVRLLAAVVPSKVGREGHRDGRRRRTAHARGVQRAERRLCEACPRQGPNA